MVPLAAGFSGFLAETDGAAAEVENRMLGVPVGGEPLYGVCWSRRCQSSGAVGSAPSVAGPDGFGRRDGYGRVGRRIAISSP